MALDFSKAIKSVEASINKYLIKGQAIPTNSLSYYNDLRTANGSASGGGGSSGNSGIITPTVYEGTLQPSYYNNLSTTNPEKIIGGNPSISYILLQNNGSHNVYFTPLEPAGNASLIGGPSLVLVPGGSWSSDIAQFITRGIYAQSDPFFTTISVTSFIIYLP
jgi:hypothetical protein